MKLYEYAVLYQPLPTKDQMERGEKPKATMIVPITSVLANNDKEAEMMAARAIPDSHTDKLDQLTIALRPF